MQNARLFKLLVVLILVVIVALVVILFRGKLPSSINNLIDNRPTDQAENPVNTLVEKDDTGDVFASDQFIDVIDEINIEEIKERAPELAVSTVIQSPEEKETFMKEVRNGKEPMIQTVIFNSSNEFLPQSLALEQGDILNIQNNTNRTVVLKSITLPSSPEVQIDPNSVMSIGFDFLGEYEYSVVDSSEKLLTVIVIAFTK